MSRCDWKRRVRLLLLQPDEKTGQNTSASLGAPKYFAVLGGAGMPWWSCCGFVGCSPQVELEHGAGSVVEWGVGEFVRVKVLVARL